jgi:hypothetical protein
VRELSRAQDIERAAKGLMMLKCMRDDCSDVATCVIGIAFYPFKSYMELCKTDRPLTRLVMSLAVCDAHLKTAQDDGAFALIPKDKLSTMARVCEKASPLGISIDVDACVVTRVEFDDPDYKVLLKQRTT